MTSAVGFYSRTIFPWLCDLALDRPQVAELRRELLSQASGEVLEIGLGTGLNLPHYPRAVQRLTAVDPNAGMQRRARQRIKQCQAAVEVHLADGKRLPFEDASFDFVVSTFTLCSIPLVSQALGELFRVLRPGGSFLFLEHGLSPDPAVQRWQRRLNRLQRLLGDNCHLDRDIVRLVHEPHWHAVECQESYLADTPKTHGYLFRGLATK